MKELEKKTELLAKSIWCNQDIMDYAGCKLTTASAIHKKAVLEHDGLVKVLPTKVKRDAVLKVLGIDPVEEIARLKLLSAK
ncbi:MAG: hypothetical protein NC087_04560 [Anaeroplasma bactoclasticum]|nr:hypothetical protein [Anaeroplasma bactoclasticum]